MGVPAFYRWLSEKYPKIVVDMLEKRNTVMNDTIIPLNLMEDNPNGVEYDNFYIDMNGLIHPCSHPEDREAPTSEAEMYVNIMKYVDRLFAAVRPRRLLYLAIDGVAPRAKMNQQRSRRFRAARDAKERRQALEEVRAEMLSLGLEPPPKKDDEWDSNVITPGTEFMTKLSEFLRYYIYDRMNKNPAWKNIKVILSDASEPGEGEHKIMAFIRSERAQPGYDPNQKHILHGLDADLIMLALATHEAHFTILREMVFFGGKSSTPAVLDPETALFERKNSENSKRISVLQPEDQWVYGKPLQALRVHVLREYLEAEFQCLEQTVPFGYDFERVVDDFVFMCFFVGNDFLPHLPSLDIRDGAIDFLCACYKEILPSMGGYITSPGGEVNLRQADIILSRVGEVEDEIFRRKKSSEEESERRRNGGRNNPRNGGQTFPQKSLGDLRRTPSTPGSSSASLISTTTTQPSLSSAPSVSSSSISVSSTIESVSTKRKTREVGVSGAEGDEVLEPDAGNKVQKNEEGDRVPGEGDGDESSSLPPGLDEATKSALIDIKQEIKKRLKEKEDKKIDQYKLTISDDIKLHESGFRDRYYGDKFKRANIEEGGGLDRMFYEYIKGLCWVLKYYYTGCVSWNWFYPFHYAPFASDLKNIDRYTISFELSQPFSPLEQLLAVLPADSAKALPEEVRGLMLDPASPIHDIYVDNAILDPNGKHLPWLWILLLRFVDETRISSAFDSVRPSLTLSSRRRNAWGQPCLFLHQDSDLAQLFREKEEYVPGEERDPAVIQVLSGGSNPPVLPSPEEIAERIRGGFYVEFPSQPFDFDCTVGGGICGSLARPSPFMFAPLGPPILPPSEAGEDLASVDSNRVQCMSLRLPPPHPHQSVLLLGASVHKTLSPIDVMDRRPPRLNKSRFNILDLSRSVQSSNPNPKPNHQFSPRGPGMGGYNQSSYSSQQAQFFRPGPGGYPLPPPPSLFQPSPRAHLYEQGLEASQRMLGHALGGGGGGGRGGGGRGGYGAERGNDFGRERGSSRDRGGGGGGGGGKSSSYSHSPYASSAPPPPLHREDRRGGSRERDIRGTSREREGQGRGRGAPYYPEPSAQPYHYPSPSSYSYSSSSATSTSYPGPPTSFSLEPSVRQSLGLQLAQFLTTNQAPSSAPPSHLPRNQGQGHNGGRTTQPFRHHAPNQGRGGNWR